MSIVWTPSSPTPNTVGQFHVEAQFSALEVFVKIYEEPCRSQFPASGNSTECLDWCSCPSKLWLHFTQVPSEWCSIFWWRIGNFQVYVLKASSKRGISFGPGHIFHRESRKVGIEYYGYYWLLLVTMVYLFVWSYLKYLIFVDIAVWTCFPWQAIPVNCCGERHEAGSQRRDLTAWNPRTSLFGALMHQWISMDIMDRNQWTRGDELKTSEAI